MFSNFTKLLSIVAVLAMCQPQACNSILLQQRKPNTGSVSLASSKATERQLGVGALGLSHSVVNSKSATINNGGYANGGTTSLAKSRARSKELKVGGLEIGSTLTSSKTKTNGAVSRAVTHDLNVGRLGVESSLSRYNLRNGIGIQRSPEGSLQLGLGLLNVDLSKKPKTQQPTQAQTQAQAQAQGLDAYARSNSNAATKSKQIGLLDFSKSQSQSNALSATRNGQTSASAGGSAGGSAANTKSSGLFRPRREASLRRQKRKAKFIPFDYPDREFKRTKRGSQRQQPNSAIVFPDDEDNNSSYLEQHAGANIPSKQETIGNESHQNNAASNIGSNLAQDGSSTQLTASNANQDYSLTNTGSQSTSNAQAQTLNLDQQAANAHAVSKEATNNKGGSHAEAQGGSQVTNNNQYETSNNNANINAVTYDNGSTHGSQADSSTQSIFQGNNGQNSVTPTNSNVNSIQRPDDFISNTASSSASAVSHGGPEANAIAFVSSSSAVKDVNVFGNEVDFGGPLANSGEFGNFGEAQDSDNGPSGFRAVKIRKRNSSYFNSEPQSLQETQTSSSTLEMINNSTEIIWPKNRLQPFNLHQQEQQQDQHQMHLQPQPQQREQQSQQIPREELHYSSINPNATTEQFAVTGEKQRNGRTFTFLNDLINSFIQPTCVYPCTLNAYQQRRCCETVIALPQRPPNVCCQQSLIPSLLPTPKPPTIVIRPPVGVVQPPLLIPPSSFPTLNFPLIPSQCCISCPTYAYYGLSSCIRNTAIPGSGPLFYG